MAEHHIAENGNYIVHCTQRVMSEYSTHNVGEVAGFSPEVAKKLIEKNAAEYAARVYMERDHAHWDPKHNPPLAKGTIQGVPASFAKQLVSDGAAKYVAADHVEKVAAQREAADRDHAEKMNASARSQLGIAPSKGK